MNSELIAVWSGREYILLTLEQFLNWHEVTYG